MYDIIVIGSGITAIYLCYQITKLHPQFKILVIEKNNYYGGRILTNQENCEFGAMRFFPSVHPLLAQLIQELEIPIISVNLYTEYLYLRGQLYLENVKSIQEKTENYYLTKFDLRNIETFKSLIGIVDACM